MKRTLVLRREALAGLSPEDLGAVAGAVYLTAVLTRYTCDYRWCYTFPYC